MSLVTSSTRKSSPDVEASFSTERRPFLTRNTSPFTFDTLNQRTKRWRRMSAPAATRYPDNPLGGATPQMHYVDSAHDHKTTSTFGSAMDDQVKLAGSEDALQPCCRKKRQYHSRKKDLPTTRLSQGPIWANDTKKGIAERHYESYAQAGGRTRLTVSTNHSNAGTSTASEIDSCSDEESRADEDETPLTSPCTSPIKGSAKSYRASRWGPSLVQVDGPGDDRECRRPTVRSCGDRRDGRDHSESPERESSHRVVDDEPSFAETESPSQHRYFSSVEHLSDCSGDDEVYGTALGIDQAEDEATPLVTPSPAKGAREFPFPGKPAKSMPERVLSRMRHPSALLRHSEGLATPRQRQVMRGGARTPDRFVPLRMATPTKESLLLSTPSPKLAVSRRVNGRRSPPFDPFGPTPHRSLRLAEQFATVHSPHPAPRPVGLRTSRVPHAEPQSRRRASAGAVWSVGGTTTTEGVSSVTNGRGGRITSGTTAPHYAADFLRRNTPSEDEVTHVRRLAFAMGVNQSARMLDHSLASSPSSSSPSSVGSRAGRVWENGGWQNKASPLTRMCQKGSLNWGSVC